MRKVTFSNTIITVMDMERFYDKSDIWFMKQALLEAKLALVHDDVPIGAVAVRGGRVVARAHNMREALGDPTAHAEVILLRRVSDLLGTWYLTDVDIYVTLEPCMMCTGALYQARIKRLVFGAYDKKMGALVSNQDFLSLSWVNHKFEVVGGVLKDEAAQLLKDFFKKKRKK